MFTRLTTFTGANNIDNAVTHLRDEGLPILNLQQGYCGVTASAARSEGVLAILSVWDSEADREASAAVGLREVGQDHNRSERIATTEGGSSMPNPQPDGALGPVGDLDV